MLEVPLAMVVAFLGGFVVVDPAQEKNTAKGWACAGVAWKIVSPPQKNPSNSPRSGRHAERLCHVLKPRFDEVIEIILKV